MKPLERTRIAVTRPVGQAEELAGPLRAAGADVLIAPLIRIAPAAVEGALKAAVSNVARYDWLVFSSVNGVDLFLNAVHAAGVDPDAVGRLHVACVGPATAEAAARHGLRTDVIPEKFVGDAIVGALAGRTELKGKRILLARAGGARSGLAEGLREHGALVDDVEVYRSVDDESGAAMLRNQITRDTIDVVIFTSASAVRSFRQNVGSPGSARLAVIGPITAQAVRECGFDVAIEADPHTVPGLIDAVAGYFAAHRDALEES